MIDTMKDIAKTAALTALMVTAFYAGKQLTQKPETLPHQEATQAAKTTRVATLDPEAFIRVKKVGDNDILVEFRKTGQNDFTTIRRTDEALELTDVKDNKSKTTIWGNDGSIEQYCGLYHKETGVTDTLQRTPLMGFFPPIRRIILQEKQNIANRSFAAALLAEIR